MDDRVIADRRKMESLFRTMSARGRTYLDESGHPWLEMESGGELRRVGLTAGNVFSPGSSPELAMQVLLARTNALLSAKANHRELWPQFQTDWAMLERAQQQLPQRARSIMTARVAGQ